ncbi:pentapeptide repeat-containing protein [Gloeocapsopsis sp. IPPAS B-1203]|uniref:pentapeptide repeat-containing protein n=1 Tax=Gloeocapsopsis sp. IPPAS B-1203 TaxID=2049454 RepID=UPI0025A17684|nr:pentapeptide repeat-containing protein [Gloeocapsopsis sp. IPPAS B-1203]
MSNLERDSLVSKIEQLERQQQVLAKYINTTKHQLDRLSSQFNNRPELEQLAALKVTLAQLHQQLDNSLAPSLVPVEVVDGSKQESQQQSTQVQLSQYQLVFDRAGSRAVLLEALEQAQERLIIVCPWLNRNSIDADLIQRFRDCLDRSCRIEIGWGHLSDRSRIGIGWRYNALPDLRQMEQDYPGLFRLKLLGTHEKFLVCDSAFAMLGSHNLLTSSASNAEREVGICTTDIHIIQGLINRFDGAKVYSAQAMDESITASLVALADVEAPLDAQDIGKQPDTILVNPDGRETDRDTDDSDEDSQETLVNTEEFLRRYNNKERDFAGINLSGANLNCADLNRAKLNKANLKGANLSKANLTNAELAAANLDNANISQSNLYQTNLSRAKLRRTNLSGAKLHNGTNLSGANLSGANLSRASLSSYTNLSGANLTATNLSGADLRAARLMNMDLSHANLSHANLLGANLEGANLQNVKLQEALYNTNTVFPDGFDPIKAGAYLITHNVSLPNKNLAGSNLMSAELSGANLSRANLVGTNLNGAALIQANLNGANLSQSNLDYTNLSAADLRGVNLMHTSLKGTNLAAADLSGSDLRKAVFSEKTRLSGTNLSGVNLAGQDLQKLNMSGVNLTGANLCGTWLCFSNFSGANLTSADLRGADLGGTNLEEANLKGANLTGAALDGAKLSGAIMPDGTVHD